MPNADPVTDLAAPTAALGQVPVDGHPDAVVRFHRREEITELELDWPWRTAEAVDSALVGAVVTAISSLGRRRELSGSSFHLAAGHPAASLDPLPEAVADAVGLTDRRDLLQLRRALPIAADHPIRAEAPPVATRPFQPGHDEAAWVRVNNRAFATHPEQGTETVATLAARLAEGWFDADGFLVADDPSRPDELSGFCWTKVHPATDGDPSLGEIYVIAVDPSHQGEGLGPSFVLAGLDHLAATGLAVANLYVDADNEPARRLYDRLGFTTHARRRVYSP